MHRRYNLAHFILAIAIVLGLTPIMVCVDVQAQIAFASHRDGNVEIYVMNINGRNQQNLTKNPNDDQYPSWSPDGERIAFTSNRNGNSEIYVMDADGRIFKTSPRIPMMTLLLRGWFCFCSCSRK